MMAELLWGRVRLPDGMNYLRRLPDAPSCGSALTRRFRFEAGALPPMCSGRAVPLRRGQRTKSHGIPGELAHLRRYAKMPTLARK